MSESRITVGIVAPSFVVPQVELKLGVEKLREAGFAPKVHPQVRRRHLFFAGDDAERAQAFFDYAFDSSIPVIWLARGGYGATRLLPWLDRMTAQRGIPHKKLLVGYSDATALMEFARSRWNWSTLHGPMPALREFSQLDERDFKATTRLVRGMDATLPFAKRRLRFLTAPPAGEVRAQLVGGNLSVWTAMIGTPYEGMTRGRLLFFEDVGESLYRVDRMVQQIASSGGFVEAKGLVLGTFEGCNDVTTQALKSVPGPKTRAKTLSTPKPGQLKPLRPLMERGRVLREIFGSIGECYRIPVASGVPVGHGPVYPPLPLGATYSLSPRGELRLLDWDWLHPADPS
jgi:muramoyltetrapeptide carboxypeptidase